MKKAIPYLVLAAALLLQACSTGRKLSTLNREGSVSVPLSVSEDMAGEIPEPSVMDGNLLVTDAQGREIMIMRAIRDDDGDMAATDLLEPSIVMAAFRHAAIREGRVELCFDVTVPAEMQDSRWQLRLTPVLTVLGEDRDLETILVTGEEYRRAQLEAMERYRRYLDGIITDSLEFLHRRDLRVFLERNSGFSYVLARDHYTDRLKVYLNDRRVAGVDDAYRRLVRFPIVTEGVRLDTVIAGDGGALSYRYSQVIAAGPELRRALVSMKGAIYMEDRPVCTLSRSEPVTFYISSLSTLADTSQSPESEDYALGLEAIRAGDYALAVSLLKSYGDFNTALAYAALGYDASALSVLDGVAPSARKDYLLAVLYSRRGDERSSVECFLRACAEDPSMVHRGNLDPEISIITRKYKLKPLQQDETLYY